MIGARESFICLRHVQVNVIFKLPVLVICTSQSVGRSDGLTLSHLAFYSIDVTAAHSEVLSEWKRLSDVNVHWVILTTVEKCEREKDAAGRPEAY